MRFSIVPAAECHLEGLYRALDEVAREREFLAFFRAPPKDECFAFFRNLIARDVCQFVAVEEGAVLGWCDILPASGDARAHVGTLGMGVIGKARGRGVGPALMEAAIAKAWAKGLLRIQLSVRADNRRAIALYERFGFLIEGRYRRDFRVDETFHDGYAMALMRQ